MEGKFMRKDEWEPIPGTDPPEFSGFCSIFSKDGKAPVAIVSPSIERFEELWSEIAEIELDPSLIQKVRLCKGLEVLRWE